MKDDKCDRSTCLYVIADCIIEAQVHLANLFNVHLIGTNNPEPGTECKHKVARLNGDALNRTHDVLPAQVAADPCPFRGIFCFVHFGNKRDTWKLQESRTLRDGDRRKSATPNSKTFAEDE